MTDSSLTDSVAIADSVEDLTAEWFTGALRQTGTIEAQETVTAAQNELVGTGQLGLVLRSALSYDGSGGPETAIVKLPSADLGSRRLGIAAGIYESEVGFYEQIAARVQIPVPRLFASGLERDTGRFTLVLEDLGTSSAPGDMLAGATDEQIDLALGALVGLHAPTWESPDLASRPWLADIARTHLFFAGVPDAVAPFTERFGDYLQASHVDLIRTIAPQAARIVDLLWQPPFVVSHGDYRLDNMMFGSDENASASITVIDWQGTRLGPPLLDHAIFLASCVDTEQRRAIEPRVLDDYRERMTQAGVVGLSAETVQTSYRRCSLYPLALGVGMAVTLQRTERGDAMWARLITGAAELALDTGALQELNT